MNTYVVCIVVIFFEFLGNRKHFAILEVGSAFRKYTFGGSFDICGQITRSMGFVELEM